MKKFIPQHKLSTLMALTLAVFANQAMAEGNWYAGGALSQAYVDENGLDDNDSGGKLFGGYHLNENFAVEASYYDFGDQVDGSSTLSIDGFSLGLVGSVPLSDRFSVFGKVGIHAWDADISGPIRARFSDDSDSDLFYGAGLDYAMNSNWTIRGEYERYEVDDFNMDVGSVGLIYNF